MRTFFHEKTGDVSFIPQLLELDFPVYFDKWTGGVDKALAFEMVLEHRTLDVLELLIEHNARDLMRTPTARELQVARQLNEIGDQICRWIVVVDIRRTYQLINSD